MSQKDNKISFFSLLLGGTLFVSSCSIQNCGSHAHCQSHIRIDNHPEIPIDVNPDVIQVGPGIHIRPNDTSKDSSKNE